MTFVYLLQYIPNFRFILWTMPTKSTWWFFIIPRFLCICKVLNLHINNVGEETVLLKLFFFTLEMRRQARNSFQARSNWDEESDHSSHIKPKNFISHFDLHLCSLISPLWCFFFRIFPSVKYACFFFAIS